MKDTVCVTSVASNSTLYDPLWWMPILQLREGLRNSKPHSMAQIERVHQTIFLMSLLFLLSKDMHNMQHILLSVFTQSLANVPSDMSVPQGDHRLLCLVLQHPQWSYGSITTPSWVPPDLQLHPEATGLSPETPDGKKKNEQKEFSEVPVRTHVYESLYCDWKQEKV